MLKTLLKHFQAFVESVVYITILAPGSSHPVIAAWHFTEERAEEALGSPIALTGWLDAWTMGKGP